jgi:Ca2+:H+ antiporter
MPAPHRHDFEVRCMVFRWLLLLVPLSLALTYLAHASPLVQFAAAIAGIVPLAEWIRRATDELARTLGSAIGGLLNVTFGNVAELLLAVFVLLEGHADVVKGQITGSIIGNGLLGLGLAVVAGSWGRDKQTFNRASAGRLSSLLVLSVIALLLPALFHLTEHAAVGPTTTSRLDERLSLGVSVVLVLVYAANLVYTLVTHRDVFATAEEDDASAKTGDGESRATWPVWRSLVVLLGGTAFVAWEAEIVSGALTATAGTLGVTTFFLGVIVLAVIGNSSEYFAAVFYARKNQMSMAMSITVGSSIQVALLVAPLLVILSYFLGKPMNLVFANPLELIAIASVAFVVNAIAQDGESTWFEGVLLLAVYALFVLAFYFVVP